MRTWSKNPACGAFCLISLACGVFYFIKNLACGAFLSLKIPSLIMRGCIAFQVFNSVYQFISSENDLNSNTEWSQRHNAGRSTQKISVEECLTYSLQILTLQTARSVRAPSSQVGESCPPNAVRPLPRPPTPASQYLWQNKTIQWLLLPSLPSPTVSYRDCQVLMHSAECKIVHGRTSCQS